MDCIVRGVAKSDTTEQLSPSFVTIITIVNIVTSVSTFVYACNFFMVKCKKIKIKKLTLTATVRRLYC